MEEKYTDKKKCEKSGFVKTKKGLYKLSALEKLYAKGRLELGDKKYMASERLAAGNRLACDWAKANMGLLSSVWRDVRVDGSIKNQSVEIIMQKQQPYLMAVKAVPYEFWAIVRLVCVENKLPEFDECIPLRRRSEQAYLLYCDLCRGLDRLIEHYCGRNTTKGC